MTVSKGAATGSFCMVVRDDPKQTRLNGRLLNLTETENKLLALIADNSGIVVTKEMMLDHLYPYQRPDSLKIIDVLLHNLRQKMGKDGALIQNVWGRGMVINPEADDVRRGYITAQHIVAVHAAIYKGGVNRALYERLEVFPRISVDDRWTRKDKDIVRKAVAAGALDVSTIRNAFMMTTKELAEWKPFLETEGNDNRPQVRRQRQPRARANKIA